MVDSPLATSSEEPAEPTTHHTRTSKRAVDWLLEGSSVTTNRHLKRFAAAPYLQRLLAEPSCDALLRRKSKALRKELIEAYAVIEAIEANLLDGTQPALFVDLCSGKGFLALLLALEFPSARVVAVDSDKRIRTEHLSTFPSVSFVCASITTDEFATQLEELLLAPGGASRQSAADDEHATAAAVATAAATANGRGDSGGGGQGPSSHDDARKEDNNEKTVAATVAAVAAAVGAVAAVVVSAGVFVVVAAATASVALAAAAASPAQSPPRPRATDPSLEPAPRPSSALCVATGVHLCGELSPRAIALFGSIAALDALVLVPCCLDKRYDFGLKAEAKERGIDPYDLKVEELRAQLKDHAADVLLTRDESMLTNAGGGSEHNAKNSILIASRRPLPTAEQRRCRACECDTE